MIEQKLDVRDIADRYFAAWRTRDPDAIASLHTEDTRFWMHAGTQPVVGRTAARAAFAEIFARFPDFAFEIYRVRYGTDHWVLDWALISGGRRFDCRDLVDLSPDGLVVRKDSFVDAGQIPAAAAGAGR